MTAQPEPLSLLAFPLTGRPPRRRRDLRSARRGAAALGRTPGPVPTGHRLQREPALQRPRHGAARGDRGTRQPVPPEQGQVAAHPHRQRSRSARPTSATRSGSGNRRSWEPRVMPSASATPATSPTPSARSRRPSPTSRTSLTRPGGQPHAPDWMFDVASWHAAQRIAAQPWPIDDRQVRFRVDTNGDLLVWDSDLLWSHQWRNSPQPRYAAARLRLSMETLPWIERSRPRHQPVGTADR